MARSWRSSETGLDPSGQHRFVQAEVEEEDVRPALALYSTRDSQNVSQIAVANASLRAFGCALSGCGRPREDPIHWLSEPEAETSPGELLTDSESEWHVRVEALETEDDVTLEPVRSDGMVLLPLHPADKA
jgi:hypothetical protein